MLQEFLAIVFLHFVAVVSPGPDLAMIVRQSIKYDRKVATFSALGLAFGILLHVLYCLLGIGFILQKYALAFEIMKWVGGGYLGYIGIMSLKAKPIQKQAFEEDHVTESISILKSIRIGFFTNALNPKATLFILSLYTVAVSLTTPIVVQFLYGVYMALATFLWFSLVARFFGLKKVKANFFKYGHVFERAIGVLLIGLALKLILF